MKKSNLIVHFDMDNTLCDFHSPIKKGFADDMTPGYYLNMDPMPGAIKTFQKLSELFDCYILSTATWWNPDSWKEKRIWVEKHLGEAAFKRLTLTHNKNLLRGDFLIDDRIANGVDGFQGIHIHFGQAGFESMDKVLAYFLHIHQTAQLEKAEI